MGRRSGKNTRGGREGTFYVGEGKQVRERHQRRGVWTKGIGGSIATWKDRGK